MPERVKLAATEPDERSRLLPKGDAASDAISACEPPDRNDRASVKPQKRVTPLPWASLLALFFCRLTEPIAMVRGAVLRRSSS